ncbi:MAG TPA: primosomal protein N', partial [Nitrospirota bacterium]
MSGKYLVDIAIGVGADKNFTYAVPEHLRQKAVPGQRVSVPFGKKVLTGFIVGRASSAPSAEVRELLEIPDETPLIPAALMEITRWTASYYRAPWGQALAMALPPGIDEGAVARPRRSVREDSASSIGGGGEVTLNPAQRGAASAIISAVKGQAYKTFMLHGATGSGKTEVYMRAIEALAGTGRGAIVLVPEISLTPQLTRRFSDRFAGAVAVMHSGLTDSQRRSEWRRIRSGEATVAIGARSAVFAPFEKVGLIVVDEEHDGSYKQEEGIKYSGRDVAVMRGSLEGCPVVLGSATPSLESYYNAVKGKYTLLALPDRAAGRPMPSVRI